MIIRYGVIWISHNSIQGIALSDKETMNNVKKLRFIWMNSLIEVLIERLQVDNDVYNFQWIVHANGHLQI